MLCARARYLLSQVTVEPILFLFYVGWLLSQTVVQNIVYTKVCLSRYDDWDVCVHERRHSAVSNLTAAADVEETADTWIFYNTCALQLPSVVFALFLGSWSDVHGRKLALVLPAVGQVLGAVVTLACAVYLRDTPTWLLTLGSLLSGSIGGLTVCLMVTFSYVADITPPERRTVRISLCEASIALGALCGNLLCALTIERTPLWAPLLIIIIIYSLHVYYALWRIPNNTLSEEEMQLKQEKLERVWSGDKDGRSGCQGSKCQRAGKVVGAHHFYHTLYTLFRRREKNDRARVILLNIAILFASLPQFGDGVLLYLFTKDAPFYWSPTTYSYYSALAYGAIAINQMIVLPMLHRHLSLTNYTICIIGAFMSMIGGYLVAFTAVSLLIYIGALFKSFVNYQATAIRALLADTVDESEQGQSFAIIASVQNLSGLFAAALFNNLYKYLLRSGVPGGYTFLYGYSTLLVTVLSILWMVYDKRRSSNTEHHLQILTNDIDDYGQDTNNLSAPT